MDKKKEEQSIEEYWGLFRDTLPGAESSVEAIYRILEVLNRQVDAFSGCDDRKERYPKITTSRDRNPSTWKISLTYWHHTHDEVVTVVAMGEVYSTVIADLFRQLSRSLDKEIDQRLRWVEENELELAATRKNLHICEKFRSSLGTYTPEQQNLPLIGGHKEVT